MRVLGLIPMRAGSKGIPGKNKKSLGGKPLMQYTIESALQSKHLTDVVVSTEDPTLAAMAQSLGAEVPFMRPEALATDTASSIDVVMDALIQLESLNRHYDAVCLLQITTPFRSKGLIDMAIEKFEETQADSLISVLKVPDEFNPHWTFRVNSQGFLGISTGEKEIITRRQDLPISFFRDGAIYISNTKTVLTMQSLYGNSISYIQSNSESYVNIDTEKDWNKAEKLLKKLSL